MNQEEIGDMKRVFIALAPVLGLCIGVSVSSDFAQNINTNGPISASQEKSAPVVNGEVAKNLDDYLSGIEKDGFAGAILLVKGDSILLRKGYGFADCQQKRRITADMVFDLGSITKTVTAVSILKLQAEGKLQVGDPISRFFDDVPPDKSAITVMQLLRHASGLQDSFGMDEDIVTKEWLVSRALGSALLFKPGEKEIYSNVGYSLLGAIIEKVSGQSYEAYVNEHVLIPKDNGGDRQTYG